MRSHSLIDDTAAVLAVSIVVALACGGAQGSEHLADLSRRSNEDGSFPDARSVVLPAVLGLEIALEDVADVLVLDTNGTGQARRPRSPSWPYQAPSERSSLRSPRCRRRRSTRSPAGGGVPSVSLSSSAAMPPAGTPWRANHAPCAGGGQRLGRERRRRRLGLADLPRR